MKALEQATRDEDPIAPSDYFARQADALVDLAKAYLAGSRGKTTGTADHYQVLIHVDESALRGAGGRADLPLESVKRLLCDSGTVPLVENSAGEPLSVGRKQRTVPPAIRRALIARDRHGGFPGCTHDRYLDAHHVQHWADGGMTRLDNLLMLCRRHHRAVHEEGFTIELRDGGDARFFWPDGRPFSEAPPAPRWAGPALEPTCPAWPPPASQSTGIRRPPTGTASTSTWPGPSRCYARPDHPRE